MEQTQILNHPLALQKISRIAYQIAENHYACEKLVILGIASTGYYLAEKIVEELQANKLIEGSLTLGKLMLDKKEPINSAVQTDFDAGILENAQVVVVDDVLESGRTMAYATRFVLNAPVKGISIAVLVDRKHHKYPIKADFVGLSLSTTLQEHINVEVQNDTLNVFLN